MVQEDVSILLGQTWLLFDSPPPPHPPLLQPQVLTQTELPALRYRFNAPIARDALPPYSWHYAPWTKCSAQCAGGETQEWDGTGQVLVTRLTFWARQG